MALIGTNHIFPAVTPTPIVASSTGSLAKSGGGKNRIERSRIEPSHLKLSFDKRAIL
jgi:hypothetical protein